MDPMDPIGVPGKRDEMGAKKKAEKDKPVQPVPPKKRWWNQLLDAVGNAIGNAKFDQ